MHWFRVIGINLLMFVLLLFVAEAGLRVVWVINSCIDSECDFSRVTSTKVREFPLSMHDVAPSLRFDEVLGFVPRESFDRTLNSADWRNKTLTITEEGFRVNNREMLARESAVLVVGDSFTFGEQVSNDETWPACLERMLDERIDNGGVSGYGAAQALKRATLKLANKPYSSLVLSVVVGDDFARDRMIYSWGRPRPAVIRTDSGIAWSEVADPNKPGTLFNPGKPSPLLVFSYERSMIFAVSIDRLMPKLVFPWVSFHREHPEAAEVESIIGWTLEEFARLEVPHKVLLLQYWSISDNVQVLSERQLIMDKATELALTVVDTFDFLGQKDPEIIWNGHHTPVGNVVVCEYLLANGFN